METIIKIPAVVAFLLATLIASGCSSGPKSRPDSNRPGTDSTETASGAQEQYGPAAPDGEAPPIQYGPEPVQLRPLTLVFGPGMARAYAQVGVLRSFSQHKIPIQAIYGTEMGSLVAALYATDSNINHFEWNLFRIKDETFLANRGLLGKFFGNEQSAVSGDPDKLVEQLKQIFGKKDISQTRIPLRIAFQRKSESSPTLLDKGSLSVLLRIAMAGPGFFGPGTWEGTPAQAASDAAAVAFLCGEAKAQTGAPVVLIDTGTSAHDPSSADLVIRPDLKGIAPADFSKKTDAAFRGKKAVEERLPELKKWAGLSSGVSSEGSASQ